MRKACLSALITLSSFLFTAANAQTPKPFDVIIDEIFPDPVPVIALPNAEYIEVKNISGRNINLQGWKLKSSSTSSGSFPSYILPADSFLIITGTNNILLFTPYGRVLGISSFPALDNAGTLLSLYSKEEATIHSVPYSISWFRNDVKSSGGWSLEMIDCHNPCSGRDNWTASIALQGGTPGVKNSVDGNNPDRLAPALLRAVATDSITVELTFSEQLDSTKAADPGNFSLSDGIGNPKMAKPAPPTFHNVRLTLSVALAENKVYTITTQKVSDCTGNVIEAVNTTRVGLPGVIDSADIIINEILFNPKPGATDYVEIYNRSRKVFNLKDVYVANRSLTGSALSGIRQITTDNILIFPGDFYVISENEAAVKGSYAARNPDNFVDITMPSLPDDEGDFVILNAQGKVVDELHYFSKWHFALLDNEEGIALERIDYNKPTQNKDNWTSAASTAGFGTPSYKNSQFRVDLAIEADLSILPKTFSPDNDGFEDYTTIYIKMSGPGFVGNISIFDATGRRVKDLVKNATLEASSSFRWDGLDDKLRKVPVGVYIVYVEVFSLSSRKKAFKKTVVVAAKF